MLDGAKQSGKAKTLGPVAYISVNPSLLGEELQRVILESRREGRQLPREDALHVPAPSTVLH